MRKNLTKGLLAFGIISQILGVGSSPFPLKVLALPQEQVLQKLAPVSVFTVGDQQDNILLFPGENNRKTAVLYISRQDAENLSKKLQQKDPQTTYKVMAVSLAGIYKSVKDGQGQANTPGLDIIPVQRQVDEALSVLRQNNQPTQNFQGVPLFYATYIQDKKEVFLTAKSEGDNVIPLYFDKQSLMTELQKLRETTPDIVDTLQIRIMSLQNLIILLEKQDNDAVRRMVLVPPRGN